MYYQGLRAAAELMPSLPWRGGVGTDYAKLNPRLKEFDDPITGERCSRSRRSISTSR